MKTLELDLHGGGRLPTLPTAFLDGRDLDLLAPLRFLDPAAEGVGALPEPPRIDRSELARALATANAAYGHPEAEAQAELLADPRTRVVVTGQQPGLYGGPLLTLTKMAAAVRWAETMAAAGLPAVAVFWVATEDHDWTEAAQATLLAADGPRKLDLGDDPAPLLPLGMRTFGPRLEELRERVRQDLGEEVAATLRYAGRWYRPDARFGEAFCRLMVHLLGRRSPLMLDSMLPEVKRLQRPWLVRLVDRRREVDAALAAADREIEGRGYPLQVTPQPGMSPLFLFHGRERRRIEWRDGESYALRGVDGSAAPIDRLRSILDENPSVVSPGVLARPAIQDAILGTSLQVMGPSELSYMAQVRAVYPVLGVEAPATSLRPQAMVIEDRHAGYLEELGVSLEELSRGSLDLLLAAKLDEDFVAPVRRRIDGLVDGLRQPILELDQSLERPWRKTRDQVGRYLDQLAAKVAAAISRRHQVWQRRLEQVHRATLPQGALQERVLAVVHFLHRFGPGFAAEFCSRLELDPRRLQAIRLEPGGFPAEDGP
jgi:bacillithiol biosynthesis cysteine-adding enzyme BshC